MQPSQHPLSAAVAASPIVLACGACDVETTLGADRDLQRSELAEFFAVHNGHSGGQRYSVTIPLERSIATDRAVTRAFAAVTGGLIAVPLFALSVGWRFSDHVGRAHPAGRRWPFV